MTTYAFAANLRSSNHQPGNPERGRYPPAELQVIGGVADMQNQRKLHVWYGIWQVDRTGLELREAR